MKTCRITKKLISRVSIALVIFILLPFSMHVRVSCADDRQVRIGVLAKRGIVRCMEKWSPTAEYITDKIPGRNFVIVPIDSDGIFSFVEHGIVDFVLTDPSIYVELESQYGLNRIATLKNIRFGNAYTKCGGVIFCKANRSDIQRFSDLKDKTFMAVKETSFGGWRMAWREFKEKGIDPYRDFKDLSFGGTHDTVVYAVRDGKVDAGTVRTDTLERMAIEGKINLGDFYAIYENGGEVASLPSIHSTRSYPEWPFAKVKHTPEELAEKVAMALLEMPWDCAATRAARCAGWTIPLNYQPVHDCLKELKVGPYKDLGKITPADVFRKYWGWFLAAAILFLFVAGSSIFILKLNRGIKKSHLKLKKEIEERKVTEKALRESEERFRGISHSMADWIWEVDKYGRYTFASGKVKEIIGYEPEELIGKTPFELMPEDSEKRIGAYLKKVVSEKKPIADLEHWTLTKEGDSICLLTNGVPILNEKGESYGYRGVDKDITERKQAEEERMRLATAIEQATESVVITDRDGTIQYVNPAFESITGYCRQEAVGQNPRTLKSGKHREEFYTDLWNTIASGKVWRGHFINKNKNGTLYEEEATISPIKNTAGEIINFVAVKRDVTEEIKLEDKLRQAQKMEAIGTLAGGIAHDFNNILSAIIGYTELAEYEIPEGSKTREKLKEVLKAGRRAKDLVKQILAFSRQGDQERKPLQISHIVKEALKLLRASLPTTIEIRRNIEPDTGIIEADPTQIHQVMMNLCTNAAHAMNNKGGMLEVGIRNVEVGNEDIGLEYPNVPPGHYVLLTIRDTGHGMSAGVVERIFDPYFTTKEKGEGTGLGLAVVHGIVKSYGGTITVYSEIGKGSTFNIYLPAIEKKVEEEKETGEAIPTGHQRILFVDDEPALVDIGKKMLEHLGHEVVVRTSSLEALEAFRNNSERFDLVISDKTMPQMTGFDLARELKQIRPDIPIILCTGFSDTTDSDKAKAMGISGLVMKPIVMREMAEAIKRVSDGKISSEKNVPEMLKVA
ncbi:MAG: PAS domain S-box protein [Proteobacteria bacterium]|nr:PAS domain S-box protein [Pseudomonadota bacterium]